MRNKANRQFASIGIFICCVSMPAVAQQAVPLITPIATPSSQNLPGAMAFPTQGIQHNPASDSEIPLRAWNIVPRVGLTATLTDNIDLSSTDKQSGLISQLTPGVRIDARTARLKMYLDYALSGIAYSKGNDRTQVQNALNTFGTLEAIDDWLFLDFSGQIAQQTINPFGVQSPNTAFNNRNTTETSTYRLSPYIRGQLGGLADYYLRYNGSVTNYKDSALSNITISQWLGQVRGSTTFQNLNWAIDGSQQNTDYSRGRDYEDQRLRGILSYKLFPEFSLSGSGGYESNNYESLDNEGKSTYGAGARWTPTERTEASGFWENRFFGTGHNVLLSHRFPLSSIRYTDTRDVVFIPNQFNGVGLGAVYDQFFQMFTNLIPDPTARATYVNNLLNQSGVAANAQAVNDYAAQRPRVQRSQQLTLVLYGSRNSITFLAGRNEDEALTLFGNNTGLPGQASRVTQQGYSINFSHRLTPLTGLNLLGSRAENQSGLTNSLDTTLTTFQLGIATRLGAKTVGAINARHSEFDSQTNPYKENALVGSLTMFF